jgi:DUF971 family protein
MSDSEDNKETRVLMWQYLNKMNKNKLASFNDLIDAVIASGYLKGQYNIVVPSGTVIVYQ